MKEIRIINLFWVLLIATVVLSGFVAFAETIFNLSYVLLIVVVLGYGFMYLVSYIGLFLSRRKSKLREEGGSYDVSG